MKDCFTSAIFIQSLSSIQYVKGYGFDWDKVENFVWEGQLDFVDLIKQVVEELNHDHPFFSGYRPGKNRRDAVHRWPRVCPHVQSI